MYTLKFVNEQSEKQGKGFNETITTLTIYENDYYRLIKEYRFMTNRGYGFSRYEVEPINEGSKMPSIWIKDNSWISKDDEKAYNVEVGTSSFSGYDLDYIEKYAHNLVNAVNTAREIEKLIKDDKRVE